MPTCSTHTQRARAVFHTYDVTHTSVVHMCVIQMCDMTHPYAQLDSFVSQHAEQNTAVSAVYAKFVRGYLVALAPEDARSLGDIAQVERIKSRDLIK